MSPPTLANIRRFVQKEKVRFTSLMYPQTGHWDSPGPNTPCPSPAARPREAVSASGKKGAEWPLPRHPCGPGAQGHVAGARCPHLTVAAVLEPRRAWRVCRALASGRAEAPTHLPAPARRLFSRGLRILENEGRERLAWAGRDRGKTESPTLSPAGP